MDTAKKIYAAGCAALLCLSLSSCAHRAHKGQDTDLSAHAPAVPDKCTDPLSRGGKRISAREISFCLAESLGKIKGWTQEDYGPGGKPVSKAAVNVRPLAVKIDTKANAPLPNTEIILIEGKTFIRQNGTWKEADADSADKNYALISRMPRYFETMLNPKLRAAGTDPQQTYSIEGKTTLLGREVTKISAENRDPQGRIPARTFRFYVTKDYLTLKSEILQDGKIISSSVVTAVDRYQQIRRPKISK